MTKEKLQLGRGLDIGTMNIVSSKKTSRGIDYKRMRDCFVDLEPKAKKMLKLRAIDFVEREDEILVLGDPAMKIANVFGTEVRRPLSSGLVSPSEVDSLEVLGIMVKKVLGEPQEEGEACYFSIPADPIDEPDKDVIYHKNVFSKIVRECGYTPYPSNEAMAVIFSETLSSNFSGIALSFGAGMVNVAMAVDAMSVMEFSICRSGDWIDNGAAKSLGINPAKICSIKETSGFNLNSPEGREQEAISFFYCEMIHYVIDHIASEFKRVRNKINLDEAIPIVVAGGTSKAGGFMEFFSKEFDKKRKRFPIKISEVRQAKNPLNCIAEGMLVQALQEYDED